MAEEREGSIENLDFHARRLARCVAILTTGGYLVKFLSPEGKVVYNQMAKKQLVCLLETLTINLMTENGGKKEVCLASLLNKPRVCMRLNKFRAVDFFSEDPMVFNLWRGFQYEPAEVLNPDLIQLMLRHMREVICSEDEEVYHHELQKLGWIFRNLNSHLGYATVLLSDEGTGKGTYTDFICDLFGPEWSEPNITNMEMITETTHAECIAYKKFIVADEIKELEHNRASWEVMKSRITDDFYRVRYIYCASKIVRNINIYYLCTNNILSIKMGQADRRYQIMKVSPKHQQDIEYFEELRASLTPEMKRHFMRFILDVDLTGFDHLIPPKSETKREIQEAQKPPAQEFMEEYEWKTFLGEDGRKYGVTFNEMYKDGYISYCDENGVPERFRIRRGAFGLHIKDYVDQRVEKRDGKSVRVYYPKDTLESLPPPEPKLPKKEKIPKPEMSPLLKEALKKPTRPAIGSRKSGQPPAPGSLPAPQPAPEPEPQPPAQE
jgi:hypothetical protein